MKIAQRPEERLNIHTVVKYFAFRPSTLADFREVSHLGPLAEAFIFAKTLYPRKFVMDVSEGAGEDKRKVLDK